MLSQQITTVMEISSTDDARPAQLGGFLIPSENHPIFMHHLPNALHEPWIQGLVVILEVNPSPHACHDILYQFTINYTESLEALKQKFK